LHVARQVKLGIVPSRRSRIDAALERVFAMPAATLRPVPVERLITELGIPLVRSRLDGDDDISGFYMNRRGAQLIAVNSTHPRVRQRFTMAHELGHAVLHRGEGLHMDQAFKLRLKSSLYGPVHPDEVDANRFAAALLMPEDDIVELVERSGFDVHQDWLVRKWALHFGVSQQALMYRLMDLSTGLDGTARFS
jgi:Zn-dependent peptidase ImmA (M78 family)